MTDSAQRPDDGRGGRVARFAFRLVLGAILTSPIAVGFWLAPKADNMPPPPELTAPPSVTNLPDAVRRVLPAAGLEHQSQTTVQPATLASGG